LRTAVIHLKKLVDAGKISKAQAEALLQELLRIYRAAKPAFRGTPAEQTNQHLALIQQAVISLLMKTFLPGLPPGEQQRIAKAIDAALGNPDYRTFDLEKLVQAIHKQIAVQAAKSAKKPGGVPPTAGKAAAQPASGTGPTASGAGQGGRGNGGSGSGGPPVAQGPNDGGDDAEGRRGKYRGGRHRDTKGPTGDKLDSHHMPAKSVNGLSEDEGPAIQMDPADHAKTASHANQGTLGVDFRARQQKLIKSGRFGEALQMEIDDIRKQFGGKYDQAIREMIESLEPWMRKGLKG